jgi:DNA-binding transcriptional ArsR family regulator
MRHTQLVIATFELLAEPTRRRILDLLRDGERPVGELVERLSMSQPAVSKHLRVLRDAGLVDVRVDAQRRVYRLRPDGLREVDAWIEPYRRLWEGRLDRLQRHLQTMNDNMVPTPAPDRDQRRGHTPRSTPVTEA